VNARKANNTKEKVQQLQRKLYLTAKENSKRRYHALYDKVYRKDILLEAWRRVRANKGAGGIDNVSIEDVEQYGVERFLQEIEGMLKSGTYHPQPVRRAYIDKGAGKKRPLGIPIVRDRVVQMAAKIVTEPIFEADFKE
jgi:RNA-directed DNA polymerase